MSRTPDAEHQERGRGIEAIVDGIFAGDDRLKADEALRELEQEDRRVFAREVLTPTQALEEAESLVEALPGIVTLARVAAGADPSVVEPPTDADELAEVVGLQEELIGTLESRLAVRERALQRVTVHRRLLPAPEAVA